MRNLVILLWLCLPVAALCQHLSADNIAPPDTSVSATHKKTTYSTKFIDRFKIQFSPVGVAVVHNNAANVNTQYTNANGDFHVNQATALPATSVSLGISLGFEFEAWKNWLIDLNGFGGYTGEANFIYNAGVAYRWKIGTYKKHILALTPGIDFTSNDIRKKIGDYDNPGKAAVIEGTTFTTDQVSVYLERRQSGISPKLGLNLNVKRRLWLFAELSCFVPFSNSDKLLFRDKHSFGYELTASKQHIPSSGVSLDAPSVQFRKDGQPSTTLPFSQLLFFNVGVKL